MHARGSWASPRMRQMNDLLIEPGMRRCCHFIRACNTRTMRPNSGGSELSLALPQVR